MPPGATTVLFRNSDTGGSVELPSEGLLRRPRALARALRAADVQSAWAVGEGAVLVDRGARTYRFSAYPPLRLFVERFVGSLVPSLQTAPLLSPLGLSCACLALLVGALFVAGCAQIAFLFPCLTLSGFVQYDVGTNSYCIPIDRLDAAMAVKCVGADVADACSARVPVTMQTFSVMLLGVVGGRAGALATALYVLMVCVGAPFQAQAAAKGGVGLAMWNKGAIIGSSGGYFWGFILASLIMGRAVERGVGRSTSLTSSLWLIPYLVGAELAIYACGLFWMPFGMAIAKGVSPSAICPAAAGASTCLKNIFNWGLVPFIPGELFKMALILVVTPTAWALLLKFHGWRLGAAPAPSQGHLQEGEEEEEEEEEEEVTVGGAEGKAGSSETIVREVREVDSQSA